MPSATNELISEDHAGDWEEKRLSLGVKKRKLRVLMDRKDHLRVSEPDGDICNHHPKRLVGINA
jgi:hypothetical protein